MGNILATQCIVNKLVIVVVQEAGYRVGSGLVALVVGWQQCYGGRVVSGGVSHGGLSDGMVLLW